MRANYHTHTRWCKHGKGEIEDFIEAALLLGMEEIAITEHVPHKDNLDKCRLQWEELEAYDSALNRAIEVYKGKISVRKGFECEYYPECLEEYRMLKNDLGYEFFFLGQHRSGPNREVDNFKTKTAKDMLLYADEVCKGLNSGYFRFLAHPDLCLLGYAHVWDDVCERVLRQIFSCCESLHIPVEINANGARDDRGYPSRTAFLLSKDYRLQYLINTDAHIPEHMSGQGVEKAKKLASDLDIKVMDFLPI